MSNELKIEQQEQTAPVAAPKMPVQRNWRRSALFVTYSDFGANSRALKQAEALLEAGYKVDVIIPKSRTDATKWQLPSGINLHFMPIYKQRSKRRIMYAFRYLGFFLFAFFAVSWMQLKNQYRYVQASTLPEFLVFTALVPRLMGTKVILDVCDLSSELYESKFKQPETAPISRLVRFVERLCFWFATDLITVHEPYRQKLLSRGVKDSKMTILMNVADETVFRWQADDEPPADEPFRLVYHGTVARRNGVDLIIQALAEVRKTDPALRVALDVYGDGDDYDAVVKMINELQVSDMVRLHRGFAPVNDLPRLLKGAQLGMVANRIDGFMEYTLPVKLLEYIALGIPAVVPRTNAIECHFDEAQVAYFTPEDVKGMAEQIVRLARQPQAAREMARAAYRFYDEHNWANSRRRYLGLVTKRPRRPLYALLKRVVDVVLSLLALLVFGGPMIAVAILIKRNSPGPILFRQERVGKDGKLFKIAKFRTMHANTDPEWHKKFTEQLMKKSADGKQGEWLPPSNDPRVFPLGQKLRKTGLDELPQLFNVLAGEMSLVGPRPPIAYEVERYEDWQKERLTVLPGITGLWQVEGRGATTFDDMVQLDIEYIERCNIWLDIYLIAATLPARLLASRKYGR